MTLNKSLGLVTIIAGGIVLSMAANGGQIITCGKSGCSVQTDTPQNFSEIVVFFFAGGIGLVALGIFLLIRKPQTPKQSFDREHYMS